jgi:hypothetical protein
MINFKNFYVQRILWNKLKKPAEHNIVILTDPV